jgi:hypothetical protein
MLYSIWKYAQNKFNNNSIQKLTTGNHKPINKTIILNINKIMIS